MKKLYNFIFFFIGLLLCMPAVAQIKLQPFVGIGSQSLNYTYEGASVSGASGVNFGADVFYYLTEDLAVGAGLRLTSYKSDATIGDYEYFSTGTDKDGDAYALTKTFADIEESHKLSAIEIPLLIRYQKWVSGSIIVYGATGPVFVLPGSLKTTFNSGVVSSEGFYEKWNLTIDDASGYGYITTNLPDIEPELTAKTSLSWALEIGGEYFINKRLNLTLTAYYQPGMSSFMEAEEQNDVFGYRGSLAEASNAKLNKVGIKFGINFDLTPTERSSIKSIR